MRIFISHSTRNKEVILKFAEFLESLSSEIEVFCSSERNSIGLGENFIDRIFCELNNCDLFIPVLSKEYYESKFCMIELGVAYSYLFNKYEKNGEDYIFPLCIYPVRREQALSGTPLMNLQVGTLNNESDIKGLIEYISSEKNIWIGAGTNKKIRSFKIKTEQIFLENQDIIDLARIRACFDDSISYKRREDVVNYSLKNKTIVINFNMNPDERKNIKNPNFISMVLSYEDGLDLNRYLDFNNMAEFEFTVVNFTNSLKKIFVEFKYSNSNRILETFEFELANGENKLSVPLRKIQSHALQQISEICFVIHPDDVKEKEGMFQVKEVKVE